MSLLTLLVIAGAGIHTPAHVPPSGDQPHSHTHAPGEIDEDHGPLLLQLTYTGEVIGNASGGSRHGTRYLDNIDVVFEADMESLFGWKGAQVHVYGLYNNGKSISDLVGDTQTVSNIETGARALRLYEAWVSQKFGESVSIKAGLYDLNSEFDALDAAGLFVSSANGIGTDFAQSGRNGPSIFPSTSLAVRFQIEPEEGWAVRAAVLDGVPGDPDNPSHTAIKLGEGDGTLMAGEAQLPLFGGKMLLGHWRYTAKFDRNDGAGITTGNRGSYIRGEFPLARRDGKNVDAFFRLGVARGLFNMFDTFAGAGVKFGGWVPGRDADEFGIAIQAAFASDSFRAAEGASAAEVAIETSYRTQLTPWLSIQPNVHYVRRPSANASLADAFIIGLRAEVAISALRF